MMQDVTKTCKEAVINESTKNKKYSKNFHQFISMVLLESSLSLQVRVLFFEEGVTPYMGI